MSEKNISLEETMIAMDAIDELRHQQMMVDKELDEPTRRSKLIEKLKKIYADQGIEVNDAMLEAGVRAMEEERFAYKSTLKGWRRSLALCYINRTKWLKPISWIIAAIAVGWGTYTATVTWPHAHKLQKLNHTAQRHLANIRSLTHDKTALDNAQTLYDAEILAIKNDRLDQAEHYDVSMQQLEQWLSQSFYVRIVQEAGKRSGIWRIPPHHPTGRNYYLIVEAIDPRGHTLSIPVRNEETGKVENVKRWGIRVDRSIFEKVARDKRDDGIIQQRRIGIKKRGENAISYNIPVRSGSITQW